jgi:hypothetical protein
VSDKKDGDYSRVPARYRRSASGRVNVSRETSFTKAEDILIEKRKFVRGQGEATSDLWVV